MLNMKDELGGILGDIISSYTALTGKELPESELLNELIRFEEIAEAEELSTEEKAEIAADLLKKLLFIETTVGSSVKKAADDADDIDPILAEMLTTEDGRMLVSCLFRLSSASIRFPAAFEFSPLESINTLLSFATAVNFVYATHNEGVFVSFAKVFDSFYRLEDSSADNPYSDLNRVTDYEKLGYRTVKLPENDGVNLTVNQLSTSEGSNSKVKNGIVINWNKEDGASGRKDPEVFINTYVDGTDNPTVTYDKGTYLFLPLDHEYEIIITTDKENNFDLPVYEHSLLGSYEVNTVSRVIDSDDRSNESHTDITIYDCDTLVMIAEGFDKDVMAAVLYGTDNERASLLIPLTDEEGAAYYPIDIDCSSEYAINGRHNKNTSGQDINSGDDDPDREKTEGSGDQNSDDPVPDDVETISDEPTITPGGHNPDESKPDSSKTDTYNEGSNPKTGDNYAGLLVVLLAASSAGIVFYSKKRRAYN